MAVLADEHRRVVVEVVDGDFFDAVPLPGLEGVGAGVQAEEHLQHGYNAHEGEHVEHGRQ